MKNRLVVSVFVVISAFASFAAAQNRRPAGNPPVPRLPNGKPDLSGVWDHPFVIDMSKDAQGDACGAAVKGCSQKGPGSELPMTPDRKSVV